MITIIYYTSNREDEAFEEKIRDNILKVTSNRLMAIVSVSQKSIAFGQNICVGKKYPCDHNIWRQKLIACQTATSPFVICAEADCLYPPEYFDYIPKDLNQHYRYENLWIWKVGTRDNDFYRKESSEGAEIVGRKYYIKQIEKALEGKPEWATKADAHDPLLRKIRVWKKRTWKPWFGTNPVISIKTGKGVRGYAKGIRDHPRVKSLPYWGTPEKLRKELFGD